MQLAANGRLSDILGVYRVGSGQILVKSVQQLADVRHVVMQ